MEKIEYVSFDKDMNWTHWTENMPPVQIRDMVIFAPQNIVTDIPFSKLDILSCRNLLIYFNRELQENRSAERQAPHL